MAYTKQNFEKKTLGHLLNYPETPSNFTHFYYFFLPLFLHSQAQVCDFFLQVWLILELNLKVKFHLKSRFQSLFIFAGLEKLRLGSKVERMMLRVTGSASKIENFFFPWSPWIGLAHESTPWTKNFKISIWCKNKTKENKF